LRKILAAEQGKIDEQYKIQARDTCMHLMLVLSWFLKS
jgi:hypothetical protein